MELPLGSHFQVLAFSSAKEVALVMTKFLQTMGRSRALLAPLISSRGICSGVTFLPSFPSLPYTWYFLSFILSSYYSMVSVLDLVDRFLLKLFSTRNRSPKPFTGTSADTRLSTNTQTLKTSLCCRSESFALALVDCFFPYLCQCSGKAGKKRFT